MTGLSIIAEVIATRERHIAACSMTDAQVAAMAAKCGVAQEHKRIARIIRELDGARVLRDEYRMQTQAARRERECREAYLGRVA